MVRNALHRSVISLHHHKIKTCITGAPNPNGIGRQRPTFPRRMWNVHLRVLHDDDRTNNHAEAAHRCLQSALHMHHPTLWKLTDGRTDCELFNAVSTSFTSRWFAAINRSPNVANIRMPTREYLVRQFDEYLEANPFDDDVALEFLRGIAHNSVMED